MTAAINNTTASFEMAAMAMQNAPAAIGGKNMSPTQARDAAKEFEAVFLSQMLSAMFEGVNPGNSPFGGGHAEDIYQSMMVSEYGKQLAENGGVGIADAVMQTILQAQENR